MKNEIKDSYMVAAELWKISICEGTLGMAHGQFYNILEVYIPKYDICFNYANDDVHVFRPCYEVRYIKSETAKKISNIKIESELAEDLFQYVEIKKQLEVYVKDFWKSDKTIQKQTQKDLKERDKKVNRLYKNVKTTGIVVNYPRLKSQNA